MLKFDKDFNLFSGLAQENLNQCQCLFETFTPYIVSRDFLSTECPQSDNVPRIDGEFTNTESLEKKKPELGGSGDAMIDELVIPIIADSQLSAKYKKSFCSGEAMNNNPDNLNFIYCTPPIDLLDMYWKNHAMIALIMFAFRRSQRKRHTILKGPLKGLILDPYEFVFGRDSWAEELNLKPARVQRLIKQLIDQHLVAKSISKSISKYTVYIWSTKVFCNNIDQQIDHGFDQQAVAKSITKKKIKNKEEDIHKNEIAPSVSADRKRLAAISSFTFSFESRSWEGVSPADLDGWQKAYPAIDVPIELNKMREWLLANPERRKTRYRAFVVKWLTRAQNLPDTKPNRSNAVDRRTKNVDGSPVISPVDGRF